MKLRSRLPLVNTPGIPLALGRPALPALLFVLCSLLLALPACGGEVVKVTTVRSGKDLGGLKEEDRAMLEEIKKGKDKQEVDSGITNVIEKTPHYTVSEYLVEMTTEN